MLDLPMGFFGGIKFVADSELVDTTTHEDWSKVRSPGRAQRRRAKHKQQIKTVTTRTPKDEAFIDRTTGVAYVHPTKLAALKEKLRQEERLDRAVLGGPVAEPKDRRELDRVTEDDFALAHNGIWSPNLRTKRFDVFPDEMGGLDQQTRLYASAGWRRGSHAPFQWMMPSAAPLEFNFDVEMEPDAVCKLMPVTFVFPELCFGSGYGSRYKVVTAFADTDSEKRFYERLREMRLRDAEDDAKWGYTEMRLPPPSPRDPGRFRAW